MLINSDYQNVHTQSVLSYKPLPSSIIILTSYIDNVSQILSVRFHPAGVRFGNKAFCPIQIFTFSNLILLSKYDQSSKSSRSGTDCSDPVMPRIPQIKYRSNFIKRKLSSGEKDQIAKRATILQAWVEHCKILNVLHPPALASAVEDFEDMLVTKGLSSPCHFPVDPVEVEEWREKKRMVKLVKIKVSTSIPRSKLLRANPCSKSPRSRLQSKATSRLCSKTKFPDLRTMLRPPRLKKIWSMKVVSRTSRRRSILPLLLKVRSKNTRPRSSRRPERALSPEINKISKD